MSLDDIAIEVLSCKKCQLSKLRLNPVPGEGNPNAEIMFIGEAPGAKEDMIGKPFVGAAGKLLDTMINEVLGIRRKDVFITNVVKCRPPNNRDPLPEEIRTCSTYLISQIREIKPRVIVTLGRHSTSFIFSSSGISFANITSVRGKFHQVKFYELKIKVFPTYHPAAALYNPSLREIIRQDFLKIKEEINSKTFTIDQFFDKDGSTNQR